MTPRQRLLLVAVLAGGFAAAWTGFLTRAPGPGLSPDGMEYLGAARSIATGHGARVPFAEWSSADSTDQLRDYPPGFPALIAGASLLTTSFEQAGRLVAVTGAALLIGGLAWLVGTAAGPVAGLAAALAFLATPAFLADYTIVLSEGPFLPVLLSVLGLLSQDQPSEWLLGLACAAGVMVRYVGLFLALASAAVLLLREGSLPSRLRRAAIAAGPALVVFVAWSHLAGGARDYGWYPGFGATLGMGLATVSGWLAPWTELPWLRGLLALLMLLLAAGALATRTEPGAGPARRLQRAALVLALCFAGMMTVSRLLADPAIIFDDRLISPLLLLAIAAVAATVGAHWQAWSSRARLLAAITTILWLGGTMAASAPGVRDLMDDGWGYASRDWQQSSLANWLRSDGRRYALFSDNAEASYSLVHRPSRSLPETDDSATVADLGARLAAQPSAVIGYADPYNPGDARGAAFAAKLHLHPLFRSDEGTVWLGGPTP